MYTVINLIKIPFFVIASMVLTLMVDWLFSMLTCNELVLCI